MKSPELPALRAQLQNLHTAYPELPQLPLHSLEYRTWFTEALDFLRLRIKYRTLDEQQRLLTTIHNLYNTYKEICQVKFDIHQMGSEERNRWLKDETKAKELEADLLRAERNLEQLRNPPPMPEEEKIMAEKKKLLAEKEKLEIQLQQEELRVRLRALSERYQNDSGSSKREDFAEKLEREFDQQQNAKAAQRREAQEAKTRIMRRAEEIASRAKTPEEQEQILRDARKLYEERYSQGR